MNYYGISEYYLQFREYMDGFGAGYECASGNSGDILGWGRKTPGYPISPTVGFYMFLWGLCSLVLMYFVFKLVLKMILSFFQFISALEIHPEVRRHVEENT